MRDIVSPLSGFGSPFGQRRRDTPTPAFDPDALAYITAVETADGEPLEAGVREAINGFVVGCKADAIWDALKASCILAGARTLNGCLVPLKGPAPTNFNFVSADYNRRTGPISDGATKYIDTNVVHSSIAQNNFSMSAYLTSVPGNWIMGAGAIESGTSAFNVAGGGSTAGFRNRSGSNNNILNEGSTQGFRGMSRGNSSEFRAIIGGTEVTASRASETPYGANIIIFGTSRLPDDGNNIFGASRIAFYHAGNDVDMALLRGRVDALLVAIDEAIA